MLDDVLSEQLFQSVKQLVDEAKQRAAVAVNTELTLLYWQVAAVSKPKFYKTSALIYGKQVIQGKRKKKVCKVCWAGLR